jgi:EAL domain-containing protein (putative c-di-GMP-specific phosphodiesterase class I)/CheY-like chemotaxis protein
MIGVLVDNAGRNCGIVESVARVGFGQNPMNSGPTRKRLGKLYNIQAQEESIQKGNAMQIAEVNFLVAEDDPVQSWALAVMLKKLGGTRITEVADGQQALIVFQNDSLEPVDIALIDLNMPNMDGMELIRHLAKGDCHASIILVTAHDRALLFSVETMTKAYGINLLGTIEKPATPDKLQALLKEYAGSNGGKNKAKASLPDFSLGDVLQGMAEHQFEPFFQPKVELKTGYIKGAEAFARWRHPQYGVITPAAFLPVLEAHGKLDELNWTIIEQSVAACRTWHDLEFPIAVSINLSLSSLAQPGFTERISECIMRHGIEAEYVILEITESAVLASDPQFWESLARLRMKGFGLSVDDYGTGNSNIQMLARIPFSELKIDRSFVAGASENQALSIVLNSCLTLSRSLNRYSVAVGVETKQDWDFLQGMGCTCAQGYYIAKPLEGAAFPSWMEEWQHFF